MYKVNYKDANGEKTIENIESISIDVKDVQQMKYIDVIYEGDVNLLTLYVNCLKYYSGKVNVFDRFVVHSSYSEGLEIIKSILACQWLINEDDFEANPEMLAERAEYFKNEIAMLNNEETLKSMHRCQLMRHFIRSFSRSSKKNKTSKTKKIGTKEGYE